MNTYQVLNTAQRTLFNIILSSQCATHVYQSCLEIKEIQYHQAASAGSSYEFLPCTSTRVPLAAAVQLGQEVVGVHRAG